MVTCWNTRKVANGFEFHVFAVGYQVPSVMLKTGICSSRAKAVRKAKAWVRFLKANAP